MCSLDDEIQALRASNKELLERLKHLTNGVYGIQVGPMSDGISKVISETNLSVEMIKKYDPSFELSFGKIQDTQ